MEVVRLAPLEAVGVDELQAEVVRTLDGRAADPGGGAQAEPAAAVVELVADLVGRAVEHAVEALVGYGLGSVRCRLSAGVLFVVHVCGSAGHCQARCVVCPLLMLIG